MDHYFILLHNDCLINEDQLLFINYLNSLLPNEDDLNYCADFAPHISFILKRNSIHLSNFNIANEEFMELWLEVHGIITEKSIFQTERKINQKHLLEKNTSITISNALHALADQLPHNGTYHLDVIITSDVLQNAELNEHLDLAGAFYRLYSWHCATFSILCKLPEEIESLSEWWEVTHAKPVFLEPKICHSPIVWRGYFSSAADNEESNQCLKGLQLKLNSNSALNWTMLRATLNMKNKWTSNQASVMLSPRIEILDRCDISTIPPYMFTPVNFTLSIIEDVNEAKAAHHFIQYLHSNPQSCFIIRMTFSNFEKGMTKSLKFSTAEWEKNTASGNVVVPTYDMGSSEEHVVFVVHRHFHSASEASVSLLVSPSQICANFPHKIMSTNCKEKKFDRITKTLEKTLNNLKHSHINFFQYLTALKESQQEILTEWLEIKKTKSPRLKAHLTIEEIQDVFESLKETLYSQLKFERNFNVEVDKMPLSELNETDPCDWPERLSLLHKQIQKDKAKERDSLSGIITSPKKTITISAKDIGKYFNSSGEANVSPKDPIEIHKSINYSNCNNLGLQQHSPSRRVHDVYCNYDNSCEEEETKRAKLKDHFVTEETASSCCNVQLAPAYIAIPVTQRRKRKSSRSLNKTTKKLKLTPSKSSRSKEESNLKKLKVDKLLKETVHSHPSATLKRSNSVPIRRSPRKHLTQPLAFSKKRSSEKCITKSDELSEKHKMKLREAVVLALESYNINVTHEMFKPCARKLFAVCKPFIKDIIGKGSTSTQMKQIAAAHAKQVVDFEMQKKKAN